MDVGRGPEAAVGERDARRVDELRHGGLVGGSCAGGTDGQESGGAERASRPWSPWAAPWLCKATGAIIAGASVASNAVRRRALWILVGAVMLTAVGAAVVYAATRPDANDGSATVAQLQDGKRRAEATRIARRRWFAARKADLLRQIHAAKARNEAAARRRSPPGAARCPSRRSCAASSPSEPSARPKPAPTPSGTTAFDRQGRRARERRGHARDPAAGRGLLVGGRRRPGRAWPRDWASATTPAPAAGPRHRRPGRRPGGRVLRARERRPERREGACLAQSHPRVRLQRWRCRRLAVVVASPC